MPTGIDEPMVLSDELKVSGDNRWPRRNEVWHAVEVAMASDTAFASGAVLTWDTEIYDTSSFHDNATNNSRLTAPLDAIYMVHMLIRTTGTITNPEFYFKKNGSTIFALFRKGGAIAGDVSFNFQVGEHFNLGDYVEAFIQFDTDPTKTVVHNPYSKFGMFRIA